MRVKLAEHSMMELMPTHLEVPFRTIERIRREVKESSDGFYDWTATVHLRGESNRLTLSH